MAPILLAAEGDRVFERDAPQRPLHSPFMSFAPSMRPAAAAALPAVAHADLTARPQTVTAGSDPWVHRLLEAVQARTGWGVLINTSFNTKVKREGKGAEGALRRCCCPLRAWLANWPLLSCCDRQGKPILNTVREALGLLRDCEDLDYVLIEDYLFAKSTAAGLAWSP